jgi:hypothetical protein
MEVVLWDGEVGLVVVMEKLLQKMLIQKVAVVVMLKHIISVLLVEGNIIQVVAIGATIVILSFSINQEGPKVHIVFPIKIIVKKILFLTFNTSLFFI